MNPDIVLAINIISFNYESQSNGIGSFSKSSKLVSNIHYLFYDYVNDQVVACGRATASTGIVMVARQLTLQEHYRHIIEAVFIRTPFKVTFKDVETEDE
ncbi:MAG: hypothetical protein GXY14_11075 [Spirochaetes bacterium]|nr:hypothetical protein [Spirochaetota bacterium]